MINEMNYHQNQVPVKYYELNMFSHCHNNNKGVLKNIFSFFKIPNSFLELNYREVIVLF